MLSAKGYSTKKIAFSLSVGRTFVKKINQFTRKRRQLNTVDDRESNLCCTVSEYAIEYFTCIGRSGNINDA